MADFDKNISQFDIISEGAQPLKVSYSYYGTCPAGGIAVRRAAHEHWGKGFRITRFFQNRCFIAFIDSGHARCNEDGTEWTVLPQHLFCMRPGRRLEVRCDSDVLLCMHLVTLDVDGPEALPLVLREGPPVIKLKDAALIESAFGQVWDIVNSGLSNSEDALNHYIRGMLLLAASTKSGPAVESGPLWLLERCRHYLREHAGEAVEMHRMCTKLGATHAYVCRLFRQYENCTPQQFHTSARMQLVARELTQTNRTLDDIAEEFGISSAFALSKMFKRQFGLSPRHFRQIEREEEGGPVEPVDSCTYRKTD